SGSDRTEAIRRRAHATAGAATRATAAALSGGAGREGMSIRRRLERLERQRQQRVAVGSLTEKERLTRLRTLVVRAETGDIDAVKRASSGRRRTSTLGVCGESAMHKPRRGGLLSAATGHFAPGFAYVGALYRLAAGLPAHSHCGDALRALQE